MFRLVTNRIGSAVSHATKNTLTKAPSVTAVSLRHKHGIEETDEEFDARYEAYFLRDNVDAWEIRKGMNDLQGYDMVPEPKIVIAAMKACRKVNDYSLAVRYLEAVKDKCGKQVTTIWPYMLDEIQPTLDELGINTPEQLGYDKPELALVDVYDIH